MCMIFSGGGTLPSIRGGERSHSPTLCTSMYVGMIRALNSWTRIQWKIHKTLFRWTACSWSAGQHWCRTGRGAEAAANAGGEAAGAGAPADGGDGATAAGRGGQAAEPELGPTDRLPLVTAPGCRTQDGLQAWHLQGRDPAGPQLKTCWLHKGKTTVELTLSIALFNLVREQRNWFF